jgi:hypothetical protein
MHQISNYNVFKLEMIVSQIYTSLINLVQKTRDHFNEYETKAKKISKITEYNVDITRQKKKNYTSMKKPNKLF